jgi:tetratricopeptide (TPR) repeat protein
MTKENLNRTCILLIFLITFNSLRANDAQQATVQAEKEEKVFVIHAPISNLDEFREMAKQAVRLKPFGRVEINVSNLADKGFHEIPEGRNYWYEYASHNPTPYKFFPDPKIAPFIPADFVKKNRELLLAKAKILREFGLEGAFWSYEPNFLPEEFFEKYPHMLGARVDHPRRGNYPAFAPCVSVEETQEMFANMVAELLKNVPEINTFFFKTNDAGSGICWSDWQYVGPNGPSHCKHHSTGERVETLMNSFKQGAEKAGKDISIYLTGSMFSDEEKDDIYVHLPEGCYFQSHNSDEVRGINSMIVGNYPVRGLFNPMEIIQNINSIKNESTNTVFISFRASYDRAFEDMGAIAKFMDLLIENLNTDAEPGVMAEEQQLYKLCKKWGGERNANLLYKAFTALKEADQYKGVALRGASGMYWGVTNRHITRPLVVAPQLLTADEESHFLPHVFNPSEEEARMDYTDIHGAHRSLTSGAANTYFSRLKKAISLLEKASETAPEKDFLQNMAKALKIHGSIFRSIGNFAEAQAIRDRNAEKLAVDPHRPSKTPTWEGDPDLQAFMTVMRDELDNAQELIDILEDGGMAFIAHADDSKYEDTFLLGPDLIDQLKLKRKIMLKHWTDIEWYLATPFK